MIQQDDLLKEQMAYYNARAGQYDEWFYRLGRYDRGEEQRKSRFTELGQVEAVRSKVNQDVLG